MMFSHVRSRLSLRIGMGWMLLALLVQTMSMLSPYGVGQRAGDMVNGLVHVQQIDHHHHDDSSMHIEEALAVETHHHAPSGLQTLGIVTATLTPSSVAAPVAPKVGKMPIYAQPWIDGWLRPPKNLI